MRGARIFLRLLAPEMRVSRLAQRSRDGLVWFGLAARCQELPSGRPLRCPTPWRIGGLVLQGSMQQSMEVRPAGSSFSMIGGPFVS
jgi:hypothetical protein